MYRTVITELQKVNPNLKVIGFTATHYRQGQGMLIEGDGLFTDVCVDMTSMDAFNWFIDEGYLCPLIPRATNLELNVDNVKIQQGEYQLKSLQEAVDQQEITYRALQETIALAPDRDHWLVFASGIEHALHVTENLESLGVPATCVHSKMAGKDRDSRIQDFKAGRVRAMVNNGILTTGFDYQALDLIVMLRPTRSPGLWVQMLGRGTRPDYASGYDLSTTAGRLTAIAQSRKQNCLELDFAGNTRRLGPINDPVVPRKKGKKQAGDAPVRVCEQCGAYCHASLRQCPYCHFEFPKSVKIGFQAGTEKLIANSSPQVETFKVDKVLYRKHVKEGKPTSLRASYYCGIRLFEKWVCLEHSGYPKKLAHDWWRDASEGQEPPLTVDEAMERLPELQTPSHIDVWINKKHPEILNHVFS